MSRRGLVVVALLIGCGGGGGGGGTPDGSTPGDAAKADSGGVQTVDSKQIGPAGGTLTVDGAVLTIPAGALAAPTTLTLTKTTRALPGAGFFGASPVYQLDPAGQTFTVPVQLAITYPTGMAPPSGVLMQWTKAGVTTPTNLADYNHYTPVVVGNTVRVANTHFCEAAAAGCECTPEAPPGDAP